MRQNPYAKIKQNSIMTASSQDLTLMLYDGAIKFANQGIEAINNNDVALAHEKIMRVENIVQEFRITLDHKYPVAKDFEMMYDYIYRRLIEANNKKDVVILEEAIRFLRELRETWKEAMEIARNPKKSQLNDNRALEQRAQ